MEHCAVYLYKMAIFHFGWHEFKLMCESIWHSGKKCTFKFLIFLSIFKLPTESDNQLISRGEYYSQTAADTIDGSSSLFVSLQRLYMKLRVVTDCGYKAAEF